jgi:CRISPR/Cas system CSM-associated protein Csm3 (group 7 of RAMP superfamily)
MTSLFALDRIFLTGTLVVVSPLHVGAGAASRTNALPEIEGLGGMERPEVKLVLRDHQGQPYIPGTTLKGVLRNLCGEDADAKEIFGDSKSKKPEPDGGTTDDDGDDGDSGTMGRLTVFGATFVSGPAKPSLMPFANLDPHKSVGVMARTRIDRRTGSASKGHLFHAEEVPEDSQFTFRAEYSGAVLPARLKDVLAVLQQGFAAGAGSRSGQGLLRLTQLKAERRSLDALRGELKSVALPPAFSAGGSAANLARNKVITLKLTCDGPYVVNDPSWKVLRDQRKEKRKQAKSNQPDEAQLKALGIDPDKRTGTGTPVLPGTSLKGALRAEAEWIGLAAADLFGSPETAARLSITAIRCKDCGVTRLPAVKLDRFSGAPFEGGLFETWCFVDPVFEVDLAIDSKKDHAIVDKMLEHLKSNGLKLGHGTNRGYGWFTVEQVTR